MCEENGTGYGEKTFFTDFLLTCWQEPDAGDYLNLRKQIMYRLARSHIAIIGKLKCNDCRITGHMKSVHDLSTEIGLQTESMKDDEGQYMYVYLFECFRKTRKYLNQHSKKSTDADALQIRISALENDLQKLRQEQRLAEKREHLELALKDCPFNRRDPKSYHRIREGLIKKRRKKKTN